MYTYTRAVPKPGDERDVTRAGGRDPHRRDRIVAAALRVVADSGAHATTHANSNGDSKRLMRGSSEVTRLCNRCG